MDKAPVKKPSLIWLLVRRLLGVIVRKPLYSIPPPDARLDQPRSVFIRHLDCGSCNGCELELNALSNPIYDIERFGIRFEASPRHADVLAMTGPFTRNLTEAARLTLEAMPEPLIIAIGDCAMNGGVFRNSYAVTAGDARPDEIRQAIILEVPGCPPAPVDILKKLAELPPDLSGAAVAFPSYPPPLVIERSMSWRSTMPSR
ncbi:MAG: hydrogenase [Chloroflexi bacterium]|nr:hydrogenase [Chloroflexota bacterium]